MFAPTIDQGPWRATTATTFRAAAVPCLNPDRWRRSSPTRASSSPTTAATTCTTTSPSWSPKPSGGSSQASASGTRGTTGHLAAQNGGRDDRDRHSRADPGLNVQTGFVPHRDGPDRGGVTGAGACFADSSSRYGGCGPPPITRARYAAKRLKGREDRSAEQRSGRAAGNGHRRRRIGRLLAPR
jgi:hypothetical protein